MKYIKGVNIMPEGCLKLRRDTNACLRCEDYNECYYLMKVKDIFNACESKIDNSDIVLVERKTIEEMECLPGDCLSCYYRGVCRKERKVKEEILCQYQDYK